MQTTKLSVLELMIWEFQKMVWRRRIFNAASRSKVSFYTFLYLIHMFMCFVSVLGAKSFACLAASATWLMIWVNNWLYKYLWMLLSFRELGDKLLQTCVMTCLNLFSCPWKQVLDSVAIKPLSFLWHMIFLTLEWSPMRFADCSAHSGHMISMVSLICVYHIHMLVIRSSYVFWLFTYSYLDLSES